MFESRFSVVICGSSEKQWAVYAFDDTYSDGDDLEEKMSGAFQTFHADPIVSCLGGDDVDADLPIWDPRRYFLLSVANRITGAANGWMTLMRTVERSIKDYVSSRESKIGINCLYTKSWHTDASTRRKGILPPCHTKVAAQRVVAIVPRRHSTGAIKPKNF
jgi:hypothetical protein